MLAPVQKWARHPSSMRRTRERESGRWVTIENAGLSPSAQYKWGIEEEKGAKRPIKTTKQGWRIGDRCNRWMEATVR